MENRIIHTTMNNVSLARIIVLLTTVIFALSSANLLANEYRHIGEPIATVYSIDEHQSGNQVWWIDQLADGQMVFATANGLTAWDGENWQHASSPNNTRMRSLSVWKDGLIYAGGVGELGYFVKSPSGEFSFTVIPTSHLLAKFGQTRSVNSNSEMVIYSTDEGVFVWDGNVIKKMNDFNPRGSRVFNINGQLLVNDSQKFYQILNENNTPSVIEKPWVLPPDLNIKSLFLNAKNQLILVTNMRGIYRLENNEFIQVVPPTSLPVNALSSGIQGKDKYYYVNSSINGLMVFSENFELLRHFRQNDGLGLATTYAIFQDRQDNIWLAGLPNISVFQPPHLRSQYRSDTGTLDFENIFNIDGNIFFSGTGFYKLTYPKESFYAPVFKKVPEFDYVVLDIAHLSNELLVGTDQGVYTFDFDTNTINNFPTNPKRITSADFVSDLDVVAAKNTAFVSIGNHLSRLEKNNLQWQETRVLEDKSGTEYLTIEPLLKGKYAVWVSTEQRDLYRVSGITKSGEINSLTHYHQQNSPLGNEHILPFMYANNVLIGTGNGVYTYQHDAEQAFTPAQFLPSALRTENKDIFKVLSDDTGRLWYHAGKDTGVIYPDDNGQLVSQENIFRPYNNSGTRGLAFFDQAIWFGVANGSVYRMSERVIEKVPEATHVSIRYIKNIDTDNPFSMALQTEAIPNENNSIRIGYALPDYSTKRKTEYRTKISGQGHAYWTSWSHEPSKDFPLLAGGDYTFAVEAKDAWGRISAAQYVFAVAYPWYLSLLAWLCYGVLLILLIVLSIKIGQKRHNKQLKQRNIELESKVELRTNEINQKVAELKQQQILKDRFFANVSHEFRTPLTLTIGPLQEVIKNHQESIDKPVRNLTLTALNNAKKMLALVSQVLDMNRLEIGTLSLRIGEYDIAQLLRTNSERFKPWAEQHQQTISCINCENPRLLYCDQDQLDKCVSNILSNAIKYSGYHAHITIELVCQDNKVGIKVSDDGIGLSEDVRSKVFERFYQGGSSQGAIEQGSGIGLNLVKEITELHHGEVELVTMLNEGCQFTLWFLLGTAHFTPEQLLEPIYLPDTAEQTTISDYDINLDQATVLVVDDNPDLRQFISQCLSANYQILEAANGEQGFAFALKHLPDIIISDVTMPGMSGLALTEKLKAHPETTSIPILLLSAQTTKRDVVAGFARGADDYLTKPFDTSELVMRINVLLKNYKDKSISTAELSEELSQLATNGDDFSSKLHQYIFENIGNRQFSIEQLAELMFMSKETLRRKCKQLTNLSTAAYINLLRIQQAKLLLTDQQLNVSEVAYAVGFDSLAYFSKNYKKHYGVSPSSILTYQY
jgi:signal transduction histidine kinase/DNA-binding response OmpR family regulator